MINYTSEELLEMEYDRKFILQTLLEPMTMVWCNYVSWSLQNESSLIIGWNVKLMRRVGEKFEEHMKSFIQQSPRRIYACRFPAYIDPINRNAHVARCINLPTFSIPRLSYTDHELDVVEPLLLDRVIHLYDNLLSDSPDNALTILALAGGFTEQTYIADHGYGVTTRYSTFSLTKN
jgi:hypothetical protein